MRKLLQNKDTVSLNDGESSEWNLLFENFDVQFSYVR